MAHSVPLTDSAPLLQDPQALREQGRKEGYLYFKGLLDPEPIWTLRRQILEICDKHGFLEAGSSPEDAQVRDGYYILESSEDPAYRAYYRDIQKLRAFHALAHHPDLIKIRSALFDDEVFTHPLIILRTIFPKAVEHTTPPHQDYYFVRGSKETWTAWIPVGDCPKTLGSLTVWPGSHLKGFLPVTKSKGVGLIKVIFPEEPTWAEGDFECGDFITFHSHTVHKGLPNYSEHTLRLSIDCRAQARKDPLIAPVSIADPHLHPIDWDGIYEDWDADDELRYYWKKYSFTLDEEAPPPVGTPENPHPEQ